jgi:4-hydroxy-2-oxoheptanedioate aldolase
VQMGASFIAVGTDSNLMVRGTSDLLAKFRDAAPPAQPKGNY